MEIAAFILLGLLIGGVIGWLYASRESAGAKHTVETLRLQLDEVVKERDVNRGALNELAALKAGQEEREKSFPAADRSAQGRQGKPVRAIPRDRQQAARRRPQDLPRPGRRAVHPGGEPGRNPAQDLSGKAPDDREGAGRPLCRAARSGRAGADRAGPGPRRDPAPRQCLARFAQGARAVGRAELAQRARAGGAHRPRRFPDRSVGRRARRGACAPT